MSKPRRGSRRVVSTIIIFYDHDRHLAEAIDGVVAKTCAPLEFVLVDDGPARPYAGVARRYVPPARYLPQANAGGTAASDTGFRVCRGKFIAFSDADDRCEPGKLERQLFAFGEDPGPGVGFAGVSKS